MIPSHSSYATAVAGSSATIASATAHRTSQASCPEEEASSSTSFATFDLQAAIAPDFVALSENIEQEL